MQHRQIVVGPLLPPDEDPAEPVHPRVRALHDPAPRLPAEPLGQPQLRLLAAARDARDVAAPRHERAELAGVVALVRMELLLDRARRGTLRFDRAKRRLRELRVVPVRAGDDERDRDAVPVREKAPLGAGFRAVHRARPGELAAERRFRDRAVQGLVLPRNPFFSS